MFLSLLTILVIVLLRLEMDRQITGIILCGGKSSRMRTNKALLKLGDKYMIEHVFETMSSVFSKVILITNTPEEYEFLRLQMFEDIYKIGGPLAGIHSGLTFSKTKNNFIISCDMPMMTEQIVEQIVNFDSDKEIVLCKIDGYLQTLTGVYSKSILPIIENILLNAYESNSESHIKHSAKVRTLLDSVDYDVLEAKDLEGYKSEYFFNINTEEDYQKIKTLL